MFPDFRLMIAAVLTSVVALSGGFGVFAALRINHEPLSRLPSATAPLQLVPDDVAGPAVISGGPPPASEPQTVTAFAEESVRESARNDGGEMPSSAPPIAAPEAVASVADEKAQAAAQPADPPVTTSTEAAADDHPSPAAEAKSVPASTDGSDAPTAQAATTVAAAGDEAKADKAAEPSNETSPSAASNVAALDQPQVSEVAPAEQTRPVEQLALAEQPASAEQPAPVDQSTRADQSATTEQTAPAAPTASPNEVALLNPGDDAADAAETAPAPSKKIARKKHAKTRVAAKSPRKHRTRVAARFNSPDSMFGQPHFASAPQTFRPRRTHTASAKKARHAGSAVGGPFVTTPGH
jgi:hypothetical protein